MKRWISMHFSNGGPDLAIVDELAHSNVPGSRNAKRYLDVQELVEAGIDVFTTLNVQHIESLNDIVAKTIWTVVRETVPDSILDLAEEIEVVDLSPASLIERVEQGKLDPAGHPGSAIHGFFSQRNLSFLRSACASICEKAAGAADSCPIRRIAERTSCGPARRLSRQGWPSRHYLVAECSSPTSRKARPQDADFRRAARSRRGHTRNGFAATRCAAYPLSMRGPCRPSAGGDRRCRRPAPNRPDRHGINRPGSLGAAFFGICRNGRGPGIQGPCHTR